MTSEWIVANTETIADLQSLATLGDEPVPMVRANISGRTFTVPKPYVIEASGLTSSEKQIPRNCWKHQKREAKGRVFGRCERACKAGALPAEPQLFAKTSRFICES